MKKPTCASKRDVLELAILLLLPKKAIGLKCNSCPVLLLVQNHIWLAEGQDIGLHSVRSLLAKAAKTLRANWVADRMTWIFNRPFEP